jgi:predicted branched-subunit amino acid permease
MTTTETTAAEIAAGAGAAGRSTRLGTGAGRDLLGIVPSVAPLGLALGLTASSLHVSGVATVLGAGVVYAGSAQLTATTLLAAGGALGAVLAAGVLVNARLLLYGAALEPLFRRQSLRFRLLAAHFVIDQTYAAVTRRPELREQPAAFRRYWLRLGLGLLLGWTGAVALGVLIGPALPRLPHLGLVGYAMFVAMLTPRLVSRPAWATATVAVATALVAVPFVPRLAVLIGAVAGITAGAWFDRRSS